MILLTVRLGAQDEQHQGRARARWRPKIVHDALQIVGIGGYKNDGKFSVGRNYRDALSAALMVSNERIFGKDRLDAARVQRRVTMTATPLETKAFAEGLIEHGLIVPVGVQGAFGRGAVFEECRGDEPPHDPRGR